MRHGYHVLQRFTTRNQWILPIFSLRIGRENNSLPIPPIHGRCLPDEACSVSAIQVVGPLWRVTWFGLCSSASRIPPPPRLYMYMYMLYAVCVCASQHVCVRTCTRTCICLPAFHEWFHVFLLTSYIQKYTALPHESSRTPQAFGNGIVWAQTVPQHMHSHMVCVIRTSRTHQKFESFKKYNFRDDEIRIRIC